MRMPWLGVQAAQPQVGLPRDHDDKNIVGNLDLFRDEPVLEAEVFGKLQLFKIPFEQFDQGVGAAAPLAIDLKTPEFRDSRDMSLSRKRGLYRAAHGLSA